MYKLLIFILFLMLCTYFSINIWINKGRMTDFEFYISFFILSGILIYIIMLNKSSRIEHFSSSRKLRHRVKENIIESSQHITQNIKMKANELYRKSIPLQKKAKTNILMLTKKIFAYLKHGSET